MRSVSQALNMLTNAMGSLIVIPLLLIVNSDPSEYLSHHDDDNDVDCDHDDDHDKHDDNDDDDDADDEWVSTNLDDGHLTYYFLLLAGLMMMTMVS